MRHRSLTVQEILVILILGLVLPLWSYAHAETVVENHVNTSASTGGNTSSDGGDVVTEGKSSSNVKVKTTVNGEVVTDINETKSSSSGSASTEVKVETISNKSTTTSKVEVNGASVKKVEATTTEVQGSSTAEQKLSVVEEEHEGDGNPVTAFLGKIFKYVFRIFTI